MTKIVINCCYGGYGLSTEALQWLGVVQGWERQVPRHHPLLVECVETLGEAANGRFANLKVVTIEGSKYIVEEYDGFESVRTPETMKWIDAGE